MYNMCPEMSHKLCGSEAAKNYITGGKGVVTLKSPTGVHHTYAFSKPKVENKFPEGTLFVHVLCAEKNWRYVGMVSHRGYAIYTRRSSFSKDSPIFKGLRYIVRIMYDPKFQSRMELFHEGCCSVCGRPLTNPKSLSVGIGPRCMKNASHRQ